ncbi:hypothetical protein D5F01_LYC20573 [Larimichthys crocea]|uniref:Uncharacterized protein n=1 Tax=Larimichthys crocea TaxID=215358 RepID=A0A6G0HQV6_LARCR|nr:hypothetical protein D5F01_LYC20573 [Larimichthys crocea]
MWEVFSSITRALLRFHFTSSPGRLYAKAAQCQAILFLPTHPLSCRLLNNAICRSPLTRAAPFTAWKKARNAVRDSRRVYATGREYSAVVVHKKVIKSKNSDLQNNEQQLQQRNSEIVDDLYQKIRESSDELMSSGGQFLQKDKAWEARYSALQENFNKELAAKDQSWERRLKQVEEEKNGQERTALWNETEPA